MPIPVTRPPLKPREGKTIFWTREELVRMDDALCYRLYGDTGELRSEISPETIDLITHMIDKINRHI